MTTQITDNLKNAGIERSVLSGIFKHGANLFIDIEEIISEKDFYYSVNKLVFSIIKYLVHNKNTETFDIPTITSAASSLGHSSLIDDKKKMEYLEALFDSYPTYNNTRSIAVCLYKLSVARQASECVGDILKDLSAISGSEDIDSIIGKIEEPIFKFTSGLQSNASNTLSLIHEDIDEKLKALSECPKDIVGLPTGFSNWDQSVGGGLRRGTIGVVGARAKMGKSFLCLNVAKNMSEIGIPVLYLDTELNKDIQQNRLLALLSRVDSKKIETGKFSLVKEDNNSVLSGAEKMKKLPITHQVIAGQSIESILSVARKWIMKSVGFENGLTKPCLIIYDYIKLMDTDGFKGGIQETQLLGFLMTSLHNFCLKWSVPVLAAVQLNRDGVEKEGGEVISGSDRILWLCSHFTILKKKSQEELIQDPPSNGTRKLVVTDTRFGPGLEKGDYINIIDELEFSSLREGKTLSQTAVNMFANVKKETNE